MGLAPSPAVHITLRGGRHTNGAYGYNRTSHVLLYLVYLFYYSAYEAIFSIPKARPTIENDATIQANEVLLWTGKEVCEP